MLGGGYVGQIARLRESAQGFVHDEARQDGAEFAVKLAIAQQGKVAHGFVEALQRLLSGVVDHAVAVVLVLGALHVAVFFQNPQHVARLPRRVVELEDALGPEGLGAKVHDRLEHVERGRIGGRVGAAGLADDRFDFGEAAQ